jgi:4-hydroxybenzoyl-CoA reductase subunit beta
VIAVRLPAAPRSRFAYRKWAVRRSIDFPLVSIALRLDVHADRLSGGLVAAGVLGPAPRLIDLEAFSGRPIDEALATELGDLAFTRCRPLENVPYDAAYRRERLRVEVRRAVRELARL